MAKAADEMGRVAAAMTGLVIGKLAQWRSVWLQRKIPVVRWGKKMCPLPDNKVIVTRALRGLVSVARVKTRKRRLIGCV